MTEPTVNSVLPDQVSYDEESNVFEITFPDEMEDALELYRQSPVVNEFVKEEVQTGNKFHDNGRTIYKYQEIGYIWTVQGHSIEFEAEYIGMVDE